MNSLKLYTTAKNVFSVLSRQHNTEELNRSFDLLKAAVDEFEKSIDSAEDCGIMQNAEQTVLAKES